jgi:hypothetical protein
MKTITLREKLVIGMTILLAGFLAVPGIGGTDPAWASSPSHHAGSIDVSKDGEIVAAHSRIGNLHQRAIRLAKIEFVPSVWLTLWLKEWETSPAGPEKDVYCLIGNLPTQAAGNFDVGMIDPRSIVLNGRVPISKGSDQILQEYPEFDGRVLRVGFNKREAMLSLDLGDKGLSQGDPAYRVTVQGRMLKSECWFYGFTFITVKGEEPTKLPAVTPKAQHQTPDAFGLFQNHPNPFNPETEISYDLPHDAYVILTIFNIVGQKVKTLVDEFQDAGHKSIDWDGKDGNGSEVSSGIYFYRIQAGEYSQTKRMVLLK